jgi:CPA1 family monovalent cation:H+ antiporter
MESISISLVFLLAVVLSGAITRLLSFVVPTPLVQIALGALIASVADFGVRLDPEVFFLLFLPPLLFYDGWRIPKEGLRRNLRPILHLALGLVVVTVLGIGTLIHLMIPAMPIGVAFALAAVISPTDPIAVSSLAARVPIPKRLLHILEGESLFNDASGLVCMRFAVAAVMTGTFSLSSALGSFAWLLTAGLAIGVGVTLAVVVAKGFFTRHLGEETGSQILISLLIPFAAYRVAEYFGGSGILAAVAAGIAMSFFEQSGNVLPATRVGRTAVWDTVGFAMNGIVFVLLGEQLPVIISGAAEVVRQTGHRDPLWLIVYILGISAALAATRFVWAWGGLTLAHFRAARRGEAPRQASWRLVAVTALAGARGAITLAGVLTLPLALPDGSPFPARDLAICLAAGVIIVSLIAASVALPFLLSGVELPPETAARRDEDVARVAAAQAAVGAIERVLHDATRGDRDADLYAAAAARLMEVYNARIDGRSKTGIEAEEVRRSETVMRDLRLAALRAERDEIYRLGRTRRLSDDLVRRLVRELDLGEARDSAV